MPAGLSPAQVFPQSQAEPTGQIDPDRLREWDKLSFIYFRGHRLGQRRTATLKRKVLTVTGSQLACKELNAASEKINCNYWPSMSAQICYPGEDLREHLCMTVCGQEHGRDAAVSSASAAPSFLSSTSIVANKKSESNHPTKSWKASKQWRNSQRRSKSDTEAVEDESEEPAAFFTGKEMLPAIFKTLHMFKRHFLAFGIN